MEPTQIEDHESKLATQQALYLRSLRLRIENLERLNGVRPLEHRTKAAAKKRRKLDKRPGSGT
jgi:hypothetical protein